MKKRNLFILTLSLFLIISFTFSTSYAINIEYNDLESYYNYKFKEDSSFVIPLGNDRYKYRDYYTRSLIVSHNKTITQKEAEQIKSYDNIVSKLFAFISGIGSYPITTSLLSSGVFSLLSSWISGYFSTPHSAAGDYYIKVNNIKHYKKNILTGNTALIESGYELLVTHNGKTFSRIIWK